MRNFINSAIKPQLVSSSNCVSESPGLTRGSERSEAQDKFMHLECREHAQNL